MQDDDSSKALWQIPVKFNANVFVCSYFFVFCTDNELKNALQWF
jgi:hypothetical protein